MKIKKNKKNRELVKKCREIIETDLKFYYKIKGCN